MDKKKIRKLLAETRLPNKLTILRIVLTPIIIIFLLMPSYSMKIASLVLFIFACITDKIDGTLARKFDLVTRFGKFTDPLADKILLNSVFLALAAANILEWWMVALMIFREFFIQTLRIIGEMNKLKLRAVGGKVKGPLQMATIITGMFFMITSFNGRISVLDQWMSQVLSIMMILTLIIAYSAMLEFLIRNWPAYNGLIKKKIS